MCGIAERPREKTAMCTWAVMDSVASSTRSLVARLIKLARLQFVFRRESRLARRAEEHVPGSDRSDQLTRRQNESRTEVNEHRCKNSQEKDGGPVKINRINIYLFIHQRRINIYLFIRRRATEEQPEGFLHQRRITSGCSSVATVFEPQ
jgi:hypothetical protein